MPLYIEMPKLADTMMEGTLVKWRKNVGDKVATGDVVAEVETDKATMDFENQDDGFVAKLLVPDGAKDIPIGRPVAVLVDDARNIPAFAAYTGPDSAAAAAAAASTSAPAAAAPKPAPAAAAAAGPAKAYPPHTVSHDHLQPPLRRLLCQPCMHCTSPKHA